MNEIIEWLEVLTAGRKAITPEMADDARGTENGDLVDHLFRLQNFITELVDDRVFLESIVENIPDMIFVKEAKELRFARFNRAGEELLGYAREDLLGKNDYDFFPEEEANFFTEKDREVLENGVLVDIPEEPIHTRFKGVRHLHTKKIPILDNKGTPLFLLGISEDISEAKEAREALEEAKKKLKDRETRLRVLLAHFPGALWTLNNNMQITSLAGARLRDLGLSEGDVESQLTDTPLALAPECINMHQQALAGKMSTYEDCRNEQTFEVQIEPLEEEQTAIAVALDVTERRKLETERVNARLLQAQKMESLGMLAGGVAHDFNNLLVGILGNAELMQNHIAENSDARMLLDRIATSADRAAELTRQMLAYSGKGHFVVEPVDLHELIGDTWELMAAAASKKVELHLDFTDDLMKVVGDISQIRQVFMNLIANAAEAIGERAGQVTITGKNTEIISEDMRFDDGSGPLAPGSYVELQVRDTGAGILPDILPKIFDPFFSTKKEGHGLGLAAVLGIVRGHSGAINVKSEPGEGTVFELWLPATLAEAQPKPQVVSAQETGHEVVLIVDDEAMVREVIREILTNSEMDVLEAKDGEEGLEIFEAHKDTITLLVLDLTMPRLGGIDTLKRIRQIQPNIRVIFTSGYTKDDVARHFTTERSPHFLKKPFTSQELLQAIADSS